MIAVSISSPPSMIVTAFFHFWRFSSTNNYKANITPLNE
jgi:hypothetical protein